MKVLGLNNDVFVSQFNRAILIIAVKLPLHYILNGMLFKVLHARKKLLNQNVIVEKTA